MTFPASRDALPTEVTVIFATGAKTPANQCRGTSDSGTLGALSTELRQRKLAAGIEPAPPASKAK